MTAATGVNLRDFTERDIDRLIDWVGSSEAALVQWAGPLFSAPLDRTQLAGHLRNAAREGRRILVALDAAGAPIGHGEFSAIDAAAGSARLSRILVGDPSRRGQGSGRALVNALVRFAADELELRRLSLGVYDFNAAAIRCYERVGFRAVPGKLRSGAVTVAGEAWNSQEMVLDLAEFEG